MSLRLGKNGSAFIGNRAKILGNFYGTAYNTILDILNSGAGTIWQRGHAEVMKARIDEVIRQSDAETRKFFEREVPNVYMAFGNEARADMRKLNAIIPAQFSGIHVEAMQVLADDAYLKFGMSLRAVKLDVQRKIAMGQQEALNYRFGVLARKEAIRAEIASGAITGAPAEEITKAVQKIMSDQGIVSLIDKGGKQWQLDSYAEMLTRTTLGDAARDGTGNNAKEFGFDLVQVTTHGSKHAECAVWEGKVLSLTGNTKGYPTVAEAEAADLFHPQCQHNIFVVG